MAHQLHGNQYMCTSTTEAEYIIAAEATREVKFVRNLLEGIKLRLKMPRLLKIDSAGVYQACVAKMMSE